MMVSIFLELSVSNRKMVITRVLRSLDILENLEKSGKFCERSPENPDYMQLIIVR